MSELYALLYYLRAALPLWLPSVKFKSKRLPCNEVFEASNSNCLMFIRKLALQ